MKYKYIGNTEMIVENQTVKNYGDIVNIDKELVHHSFKKIEDEKIYIQIFKYGGKK